MPHNPERPADLRFSPATLARAPWAQDERRFPVMRTIVDGAPRIELLLQREFPRWAVASPFSREIRAGRIAELRCFLTGCRVHLARMSVLEGRSDKDFPWALSREHLVPIRDSGRGVRGVGNIVPTAWRVNNSLGHQPLAVKLHLKERLAAEAYDRDSMTLPQAEDVLRRVIAVEAALSFRRRYPWQPWTYKDPEEISAVKTFCAAIYRHQDEFLALDDAGRRAFLARPLELDLSGLHRRWLQESGAEPQAAL